MPPKKPDHSIGALFRGIAKKANDPKNNPKPKSSKSNSLVIKPKKSSNSLVIKPKKTNGKKKNGKKKNGKKGKK
tara:strand:- start:3042 stop:3263 length:222 start_codon:yes stop_codon:yes gene_type:complete